MKRSFRAVGTARGRRRKVKVVLYGLGPIGIATGRVAASVEDFEIVGAVDIDPAKVGKDLGRMLRAGVSGVRVTDDAKALLKRTKPDVVLHCTASHIPQIEEQLREIILAGAHVVSSSEELSWPSLQGGAAVKRLDALAKKKGVTVFGTGVNPGFVMDVLPLNLTSVCIRVDHVRVTRIVDAATRREPLQRKVGAGMTRAAFEKEVAEGRMGHVGLPESVAMLAAGCGFEIDKIEEEILPVMARAAISTQYFSIKRGRVCGIRQTARGLKGRKELIYARLEMYIGAKKPGDSVEIKGVPDMRLEIPGGTAGDLATPAAVVNAVHRVMRGPAGVVTALDLSLPCIGGLRRASS